MKDNKVLRLLWKRLYGFLFDTVCSSLWKLLSDSVNYTLQDSGGEGSLDFAPKDDFPEAGGRFYIVVDIVGATAQRL